MYNICAPKSWYFYSACLFTGLACGMMFVPPQECIAVITCAAEFELANVEKFEGPVWFFSMVVVAFWLQIAANFIWLKNSQISREIMQLDIGSSARTQLVLKSLFWTSLSTIVWIARIMLIIGNNIWIYVTVLVGNIVGTGWASIRQEPDKHSLVGDMEALLLSNNLKVDQVLKDMHAKMQVLSKQTENRTMDSIPIDFSPVDKKYKPEV